jgi:hypothetical protein
MARSLRIESISRSNAIRHWMFRAVRAHERTIPDGHRSLDRAGRQRAECR